MGMHEYVFIFINIIYKTRIHANSANNRISQYCYKWGSSLIWEGLTYFVVEGITVHMYYLSHVNIIYVMVHIIAHYNVYIYIYIFIFVFFFFFWQSIFSFLLAIIVLYLSWDIALWVKTYKPLWVGHAHSMGEFPFLPLTLLMKCHVLNRIHKLW